MRVSDFLYFERMYFYREPEGRSGALVVVERDYRCFFKLGDSDIQFVVPAGTMSNGASVPKVVPRWIVESIGPHFEAAVIHDHLCREFGDKAERPWTSRVAADIFNEAMRAARVADWRRELMYRAVVTFGPQWGTPELKPA